MEILRDDAGMAHIVALSGGKDSTCMALRLRELESRSYMYICTPTGDELPEMFEHWRNLSIKLEAPIYPIVGGTLASVCRQEKSLPNFRMRFCTRILKIIPYKNFLMEAFPCVSYVGLRADETEREGIDHGGDILLKSGDGVSQRYPMMEWGWGLAEVLEYLKKKGIKIPERTDCARCFWQKLGEWYNLWRDHSEIYQDAVDQEIRFGHTFRSEQRDTWPAALIDLRKEFQAGRIPTRSLNMMESRKYMCRACSL